MAGEKTEQPTQKKIEDSRKKGQVFKSQDITQAVSFLTAAGILAAGGGLISKQLLELLSEFFRPELLKSSLEPAVLLERAGAGFSRFLLITAPILVALALVTAMTIFLQVKPLFSAEVVQPKFDKLNPIQGFQGIFFKSKTYIEMGKNLLKLIIVLALAYSFLRSALPEVILASRLSVTAAFGLAGSLVSGFLLRAGVVFLLIGGADFLLQKKLYMKNLMMSKDDIKQEHKQSEGDPHVKHMRKHLAQQMLMGGATVKVPTANVVVVNPTHLAVALKYDESAMNAPQIVAKGREELAAKIRSIAEEHHVPIVQNVGLARGLYAVELDGEIPEELYAAVAEILNWVAQLQQELEQTAEAKV